MKEFSDISFKPINQGVGFSSEEPKVFSYYEKNEDSLLEDSNKVFENLLDSPEFFDRLEERLEDPILESLTNQNKRNHDHVISRTANQPSVPSKASIYDIEKEVLEENSPLNWFFLPSFTAIKLDFTFSLGLYLFGGILTTVAFELTPHWLWILFGYGIFHQLYLMVSRVLIGSSLGEERCNISWNTRNPLSFILRGLLFTFTGFILLPLASVIFRKNLLESCTGQKLEYNV